MAKHWTADEMPDQAGRTVVTGANSGLGLETAGARPPRRLRRARLPRHGQGRAGPPGHPRLRSRRRASARRPGPGGPRVGEGVRRKRPPGHGDRPADQQRRRDGPAPTADEGRLRAADRHQPAGALRPHRRAAGPHAGPRGRPRGDALEQRPQDGPDQVRRPPVRAPLQPLGRLQPVQARRPGVRARARPPAEASGSTVKSVAAHPGYAATNLQSAAPPAIDR